MRHFLYILMEGSLWSISDVLIKQESLLAEYGEIKLTFGLRRQEFEVAKIELAETKQNNLLLLVNIPVPHSSNHDI